MSFVCFKIGSLEAVAEIDDSLTARRILESLPLRSKAKVWGQEVYFETDLELEDERPQAYAPPGSVAYWAPGKAICLFYGQTPASPINLIGMLRGNPGALSAVDPGDEVTIELLPNDDARAQS